MYNSERPETGIREDFTVGVLPGNIYDYLQRKGGSGDLLLSKIFIDENLSVDDLATIFYVNRQWNISDMIWNKPEGTKPNNSNITIASWIIENEIKNMNQPDTPRLASKVQSACSWAYSDRIEQDVTRYLSSVCSEASSSYEFVVTGPKIWLIVKSGFITMMRNPTTRLEFYRDYLKTVGKISPYGALQTDVFAHYVEELVG